MSAAIGDEIPVSIGIDIGSTNTKVVALDGSGRVVGRRSLPTPRLLDGSIEPAEMVQLLEKEILDLASAKLKIFSIATAGVGEDGFLANQQLQPLTSAMSWFDPRRQSVIDQLKVDFSDDCDSKTGVDLDAARTVTAWAWLKKNEPHTLKDATYWIGVTDYPLICWTKKPYITDNLASRSAAWSPWNREWIRSRIEQTLGPSITVPQVIKGGSVIGRLVVDTLAPVLAAEAVAVNAGHDHPVGGWAVSQISPGAILDSMGTAEVITLQIPDMPSSRLPGFDVSPGIGDFGATVLHVNELARNVEWVKSNRPDLAAEIDKLLLDQNIPLDLIAISEVLEVGMQGGGEPRWTKRAQVLSARALALGALADIASATKSTIEALGISNGIYASGGWVRSPGWMAIKEAVIGSEIEQIQESEVTACAAALIAGKAIGWEQDPSIALRIEGQS